MEVGCASIADGMPAASKDDRGRLTSRELCKTNHLSKLQSIARLGFGLLEASRKFAGRPGIRPAKRPQRLNPRTNLAGTGANFTESAGRYRPSFPVADDLTGAGTLPKTPFPGTAKLFVSKLGQVHLAVVSILPSSRLRAHRVRLLPK